MTQSFAKDKLSGSTDGMGIKVVATATPGTAVHTAPASTTTAWDEIYLWAENSSTSDVLLTVEFGDATAPDHNIIQTIPAQGGPALVVPGFILQNSKTVKAFAGTANVLTLTGYVHHIT